MGSLIERLRSSHRRLEARPASSANLLDDDGEYQRLHVEFQQHLARVGSVSDDLDRKKRRECDFLLRFLLSYDRLPARRVAIGEAPDFRFSLPGRRIGLELVEPFVPHPHERLSTKRRGSIRKEQEGIQDRIVERAMALHAEAGGKPMRLRINFADTDFRARGIEAAARSLAKIVPPGAPCGASINKGTANRTEWPHWLGHIHVGTSPAFPGDWACWDACHGGAVHAAEDVLPPVIREKERKLSTYRQVGCDEYWLLVIVAEQAASSFIKVVDNGRAYVTEFSEVFVFWPRRGPGRNIMRLNCARRRRQPP